MFYPGFDLDKFHCIKSLFFQSATELRQSYTALKEGKKRVPIPNAKQNKEIQQFYQKIIKADKKNGKIKNASLTAPATNYCQMLQEIAEAQRFEVNYLDIDEISQSGRFVSALLQISLRILSISLC